MGLLCDATFISTVKSYWQIEDSQQERTDPFLQPDRFCVITTERSQRISFEGTKVSMHLQTEQTLDNERILSQGGCRKFAIDNPWNLGGAAAYSV